MNKLFINKTATVIGAIIGAVIGEVVGIAVCLQFAGKDGGWHEFGLGSILGAFFGAIIGSYPARVIGKVIIVVECALFGIVADMTTRGLTGYQLPFVGLFLGAAFGLCIAVRFSTVTCAGIGAFGGYYYGMNISGNLIGGSIASGILAVIGAIFGEAIETASRYSKRGD